MNLIIKYLKRATVIELLTILFFLSVGVSLTFKIGFYNALGAGWYIQNLTPQQLFISTLRIIFVSFGGVFLGYLLGTNFSEKIVSKISFVVIAIFVVYQGLIEPNFKITLNFNEYSGIILFLFNVVTSMYIVSLELKEKRQNNQSFVGPLRRTGRFEALLDRAFKYVLFFSLFFLPYVTGGDAGKLARYNKYELNEVVLKDNTNKWNLIDMSGDKVLLKQLDTKDNIFKLVEYKDIETITRK